jgi:tripartite-type tricarboxylate transporter receptor subunit TctC
LPGVGERIAPQAGVWRRRLLTAALAAPLAVAAGRVASQARGAAFPSRTVRIVVPNAVGGTSDLLARLVAAHLADDLGQAVVVENRPGAAGRIALDHAAKAVPDGHTLLLGNNGTNAITAPGDALADAEVTALTPIIRLTSVAIVIAVVPSLGVATLGELIERARREPGKLSYASSGVGSTSHLAAALFAARAGIEMVQIPYSGTAAAVKDVLSGDVPVLFTQFGTIAANVKAGQLRLLAVTDSRRAATYPEVPTVAESGFPGFRVTTWHGVLAPPATPGDIVARLHRELARIIAAPVVREQLVALGMEPAGSTPEQFAEEIRVERERWLAVARTLAAPPR